MTGKLVPGSSFSPVYEGGYPTPETAEAAFEAYDFQAAVQFYVWGYAYLNGLGLEKGLAVLGGDERSVYVFDRRVQPQHVLMTANDEVVYSVTRSLDLRQGPLVIEAPPRCRGHVFDIGMRAYEDIGDVGPDRGAGGKFLLMARDYDGEIPSGYHPVRSLHSDLLTVIIRTFPTSEGSVEAAAALGRKLRVYPLSQAGSPPRQDVVLIGDRPFSQDWPRDARAFEWLAEVTMRDRLPAEARAHLGNMRRLGLEPSKGFAPDARARSILERAAGTAEAIVLSMAFRNRAAPLLYDKRQWQHFNANRDSQFLPDGYEEVEERAGSWHLLVGNGARYIPAEPGTGQYPLATYRDSDGNRLMGSNLYRFTIPANVPVKQFWQLPIYSTTNRSFVQTNQGRATISSTDEGLVKNDDGSVDIYIGPQAPKGFEPNWIETNPGEGWFTLFRLYGPLEPILRKEWVPNDIERVR